MKQTFDLTGWDNPGWKDARVVILGAGASGFAAADTLVELGSDVLVIAEDLSTGLEPLFNVLGVEKVIGASETDNLAAIKQFDPTLAIISPNFPKTSRLVQGLELRQNPVWSEAELAWRLRDKIADGANWIMLTGSGAPTIAEHAVQALAVLDIPARILGHGYQPVCDGIRDPEQPEFFFIVQNANQLSSTYTPQPKVSLYSDSMGESWHAEEYEKIAAVGRIYQNTELFAVYPEQDEYGVFLLERADVVEGCRAIGYSLASPQMSQIGIVDDLVVDRAFIEDRKERAQELFLVKEMMDTGLESLEDIKSFLAVATVLRAIGLSVNSLNLALFDVKSQ